MLVIRVRWAASAEQGEAITRMFSTQRAATPAPAPVAPWLPPHPPLPVCPTSPSSPLLSRPLSSSGSWSCFSSWNSFAEVRPPPFGWATGDSQEAAYLSLPPLPLRGRGATPFGSALRSLNFPPDTPRRPRLMLGESSSPPSAHHLSELLPLPALFFFSIWLE